jgi:hypothetical protein
MRPTINDVNRPTIEDLENPSVVRVLKALLAGEGTIYGRMQSSVDDSSGLPYWIEALVWRLQKDGVTAETLPAEIESMIRRYREAEDDE